MPDKTFIVENPKTRQRFTITGSTLKAALKKERLSPLIWKLIEAPESPPEANFGEDN